MFTGLIEEIGTVEAIHWSGNSAEIRIKAKAVLEEVKIGDSIATNGICLTVTRFGRDGFSVDAMSETMKRTNLSLLRPGSPVNLERALRVGDRLGGHMVSGHIDGTGRIRTFREEYNAVWVEVEAEPALLRYIVEKGSIAIDGISLTVAAVDPSSFHVSIIPHTKGETTLLGKAVGDAVNLECDMVGKYIEKFLLHETAPKPSKGISQSFLEENGFL